MAANGSRARVKYLVSGLGHICFERVLTIFEALTKALIPIAVGFFALVYLTFELTFSSGWNLSKVLTTVFVLLLELGVVIAIVKIFRDLSNHREEPDQNLSGLNEDSKDLREIHRTLSQEPRVPPSRRTPNDQDH